MTDDLVTWLRAQLDEEQARAQLLDGLRAPSPWRASGDAFDAYVETADGTIIEERGGTTYLAVAKHIAEHDPARVLAEVDAKRRILDLYEQAEYGDFARLTALDDVIRLLALPYAERPGYRPEWAPST